MKKDELQFDPQVAGDTELAFYHDEVHEVVDIAKHALIVDELMSRDLEHPDPPNDIDSISKSLEGSKNKNQVVFESGIVDDYLDDREKAYQKCASMYWEDEE